jgi:hypothetical protein
MAHPLSRRTMIFAALAAGLTAGCAGPAARRAVPDPETRLIGFDLWSGVPGSKFGDPIRIAQGSRVISGPIDWTHPVTGERLKVYERRNAEISGEKVQLFAMSDEGAALARVFDRRPGRPDRHFVGDAFFPIGIWSKGERRSWTMTEYEAGKVHERVATIRIRRLNFTYDGTPDALRYDWILTDKDGGTVFDERYVHGPSIGFMRFTNRLR